MGKKITALCWILSLAILLATPAAAAEMASPQEVGKYFGSEGYYKNGIRQRGDLSSFEGMTARPGDEIFFPLESWYFTWDKNSEERIPEMTPRDNQTLNLGVSVDYVEGQEAFDRIAVTSRENRLGILIDFADALVSFDPVKFQANCRLTVGGGEVPGGEFEVSGLFRNRKITVTSADRTVTLGKGRIAVGSHLQDLANVPFDLGCGVTLTADLLIAQQVYGHAENVSLAQDKEVMVKNPQIRQVVRVYSMGFAKGKVRLDPDRYGNIKVYGPMMSYLGTTRDALPLESVYYLAAEK